MAGLQLICPRVSMLCVSSRVRRPMRAAARAASAPAWPPPTTTTAKEFSNVMIYSAIARGKRPGIVPEALTLPGKERAEAVQVRLRKLARLDLETIVPVTALQPLEHVAQACESARSPLRHHMTVLVQEETRIGEKVGARTAQIDRAAPGRGHGSWMQPREKRILDDAHLRDAGTEERAERGLDFTRQGNDAALPHAPSVCREQARRQRVAAA